MNRIRKSSTATVDGDPDCTEVLEDGSKSILLGIISQLRKDMDLHRVTLPTFVLEPRSLLERITDFMSHPELLLAASKKTDPLERFIAVTLYFLSGWHIKPKGVKKPYNPVLGEFFRCRWQYDNGTEALYVAEQVSHHPPVSAFYYASPRNGVSILGDIRPKSRFLGNSVATLMEGTNNITFHHWDNELYIITMPNMYARGILFGKMVLELGDSCEVRCPKNDFICELDFKTKGFFSGQYNTVVGKVKKESTGEVLREISGTWSKELFIKVPGKTTQKELYFDATTSPIHPKLVEPEAKQEETESRRLWSKVTAAMKQNDMDTATAEKTLIEDKQRDDAKMRKDKGIEWQPRFFKRDDQDNYTLRLEPKIDIKSPSQAEKALDTFIFDPSGEGPDRNVTCLNTTPSPATSSATHEAAK